MSEARPYAVGATVKWLESGAEFAGMIVSLGSEPEWCGTDLNQESRQENRQAEAAGPVYVIALSDQSVVVRHHRDLVLV